MSRLRTGYSTLQIGLHWLIAILILAAWFTGEGMGKVLDDRIEAGITGIAGNTWHVWLGGTIFALVLIRIIVRFASGAPAPEPGPAWQEAAAVWGHKLLYALMVLVPFVGAAAWYGHMAFLAEVHEPLAKALMIVALGHAAVAIHHHYIVKDDTLRRMLRPGG